MDDKQQQQQKQQQYHNVHAISDVLYEAQDQGPNLEEDMALIDSSQFCAISLASGNEQLKKEYKKIHMELVNIVEKFTSVINEKSTLWSNIISQAGLPDNLSEKWFDHDTEKCQKVKELIEEKFQGNIANVVQEAEHEIVILQRHTIDEINGTIEHSKLHGKLGISLDFLREHMKLKVKSSLISIYPIIARLTYMSGFLSLCGFKKSGGRRTRRRNKKPHGKSKKPRGKTRKPFRKN
jgi:hypothetical protein